VADLRSEAGHDLSRQAFVIEHRLLVPSGNTDIGLRDPIVERAQRAYRAERARPDLSQLRDIGGGTDRRLTQILLLGIGPADPLHVDLAAGVLRLEDIERLAHLRRLGIVEAERDRGICSAVRIDKRQARAAAASRPILKRAIIRPPQ
jgi:hypothetical protein